MKKFIEHIKYMVNFYKEAIEFILWISSNKPLKKQFINDMYAVYMRYRPIHIDGRK